MHQDQRNTQRVNVTHPIQISFGSQIVLQGQLKDLSLKSAFVILKGSVHMAANDQLAFLIENIPNIPGSIKGSARISRIIPGEGIAIYFIKIEEESVSRLQRLIKSELIKNP
jgi:hypothetical protein